MPLGAPAGMVTPRVGRLAPSPTGLLHLGHARTFVLAWWQMRAVGGTVRLRIEDLDGLRASTEMADASLRDLEWLGLDWDGPVVHQSQRLETLEARARELVELGAVYPCVCSRADIRAAQSAPHGSAGEDRYPGTCRGRYATLAEAERDSGKPAALRFAVTSTPVTFEDVLAGACAYRLDEHPGDFVVAKRDHQPAYQLAVVVDDATDGVTDVVRGDDLLSSTARQKVLQTALGLPHPRWAHVPLVLDRGGQRLAKRARSVTLGALRDAGVDPRAILHWVAETSGMADRAATALEAPTASAAAHALAQGADLSEVPREPVQLGADPVELLLGAGRQ